MNPGQPMNPDCAVCVHSQPAISDDPNEGPLLWCHRYPPQVLITDDEVQAVFPPAMEPCGEWSTSGIGDDQ